MSLLTENKVSSGTHYITTPNLFQSINIFKTFLSFRFLKTKQHELCHTGIRTTYHTFSQYSYILFLAKWLSFFIHDWTECQRVKHFKIKIQTAPRQFFSKHDPSFNYRIALDTKGPIIPPWHTKSYHVDVDAFPQFVLTVSIKSNNAKIDVETLLLYWMIKIGPPCHSKSAFYLVTDRG